MTENRKLVTPYDPELYDLIHRGYANDVDFYRTVCRDAEKTLELGCGSGRIALKLAQDGLFVVGLDNHPGMLNLLEKRRQALTHGRNNLKLIEADMADFALNERFDRIIIPFNGLFCLLDDPAVLSCFSRILSHLKESGRLIFDVYRIDPDDDIQGNRHDEFELLTQVVDKGRHIEVFERYAVDPARQRIDAEYLYKIETDADDFNEVVCQIPQHYLFIKDIERLLSQAGLRAIDIKGGYDDEPPNDNSPIFVIEAEKQA
jgi:SAM-dependent methyltransferase